MPQTLDQLLREFRRALLALDADLARDLIRAHRTQVAAMGPALRGLVETLRQAGQISDAARWVRDTDAAARLLSAAESGMADFGAYAAERIEARRQELIALSAAHDERLTYASVSGAEQLTPGTASALRAAFSAIPVEAVTSIVGALQPASPLRALFDTFGPETSRTLGERLVNGITHGHGAEQIARELRGSLDGDAARALTIARTEPMRAYRSSSLDRYRAKPKVYAGWRWHANLDRRTCPVCIAQHGSEHALDEDFGGHPNCRCRPIPITRSIADILGDSPEARDIDATVAKLQGKRPTGPEWFAKQSRDEQRAILGPLKHDAMLKGRIELHDVVVAKVHPQWGLGHRTGSLREAERAAKARGFKGGPTKAPKAPKPKATTSGKAGGIRVEHVAGVRKETSKQFDAAVRAIRKVHDPDVLLRFDPSTKGLGRSLGHFDPNGTREGTIRLKDVATSRMTAVHEIGHAIDHNVFGDSFGMGTRGWSGEGSPQYAWRVAIRASGASKRLREAYRGTSHLKYARSETELWARSYEQWVTLRSGNRTLRSLLVQRRKASPAKYWTDDEFGPIAAAFDSIFGVKP